MKNVTFTVSATLIVAFVALGAVFTQRMEAVFQVVHDFIVTTFGWYYILTVTLFLVFVIALALSPYGRIKLGRDSDEPEYSYFTWFAMLFAAGMGIGIMFWSVAEPMLHYATPVRSDPETTRSAREAMTLTFFHWGVHAWAIYIVVGMSLAYFSFRHRLPLTIRSSFVPLIGRRVHGPIGDFIEILAIFGTVFGIATSLGLGAMQISAGLDQVGLAEESPVNQVILIAIIASIAAVSVYTGLNVGIRRLSEFNILFGFLLVLFVFIVGPTIFLLNAWVQGVGDYVREIAGMSLRTGAFEGGEWQQGWTMFYWGWWISWSPFVGMFIARISRGRTIREFVIGVMLVPTLLTTVWMAIFGNTALHMQIFGNADILAVVQESEARALFAMLEQLPLSLITSIVAMVVITLYFVTSSDSGSLVVSILSSGGDVEPPVFYRLFWAALKGVIAAVLLLTGGLVALQTAAITTAGPFSVVMLFMCYGLYRALRRERLRPPRLREALDRTRER